MCMTLGGRVAEEIFFGRITTGASDDLQKVSKMAWEICSTYGMNDAIGPVSYGRRDNESFQKPFSEKTGQMLDDEVRSASPSFRRFPVAINAPADISRTPLFSSPPQVRKMIQGARERTRKLLEDKREQVELVAQQLLEKEILTRCVASSSSCRPLLFERLSCVYAS